jgi:hypothetical protein
MKVRTHSGWDSQPGGIGDALLGALVAEEHDECAPTGT